MTSMKICFDHASNDYNRGDFNPCSKSATLTSQLNQIDHETIKKIKFSGTTLTVKNGHVTCLDHFMEGMRAVSASPIYLPSLSSGLHVDEDLLEDEGEYVSQVSLNNKPFTGCGYQFNMSALERVTWYHKGDARDYIVWGEDGRVSAGFITRKNGQIDFLNHRDGTIDHINLYRTGRDKVSLKIDRSGAVRINGNAIDNDNTGTDSTGISFGLKSGLELNLYLSINRVGPVDAIINGLLSTEFFDLVPSLWFSTETTIHHGTLTNLLKIDSIKNIFINESSIINENQDSIPDAVAHKVALI